MLCNQARRPRVKERLAVHVQELEAEIREMKAARLSEEKQENGGGVNADVGVEKAPVRPMKKITTYGWDQSDKFAKIYVTANGVHSLDKSQVTCDFGTRSFNLVIRDLDGANRVLEITNLHDAIVTDESYYKVKTDNVLIMLKKTNANKSWPAVVRKLGAKVETETKPATEEDPSAGLMSLMKKMYDEGDDEMKRTINKAWSESRDKQGAGGPGMEGMGGMGGMEGMMGGMGMGGMGM